ncbi:MAG: alpha/beta hydrolase [Paracoccaceae bacterium]
MVKKLILWAIVIIFGTVLGFRGAAGLRETAMVDDMVPNQGRMVSTAMGDIYLEENGPADGIPVLLVHGSIGWAGLWRETSQALAAAGYRAIAFDMPPMGFSQRDAGHDYGRENQARRVLALVDALAIKPQLVAHSFGAGAATEAVMMAPDAFAGLVLVDAALGLGALDATPKLHWALRPQAVREALISLSVTNPLATKTLLAQFLHRKDRANDYYVGILQEPMALVGTTAEAAHWLPTLLVAPTDARSRKLENFAGIAVPVAIIWGEQDTATPPDQAHQLVEIISPGQPGGNVHLTMLPNVGHIPQIEDPAQFNAALISTLLGMENQ